MMRSGLAISVHAVSRNGTRWFSAAATATICLKL
jgi:hypothetical protein